MPIPLPPAAAVVDQALIAIVAVATLAFALSGLLEAARKRLDVVGIGFVAALTAFGGGTLRDVLLDRRPFFWVQHANWLWALLALLAGAGLTLGLRALALATGWTLPAWETGERPGDDDDR